VGALLATLPFIVLLVAAALWAERRYARFDRLPGHYDWRGRATCMGSRQAITLVVPALFALILLVMSLITILFPPEQQSGSLIPAVLLAGLTLLVAYALILWLTERWVSAQDR
jgi:hypothetical protein